MRRLCRVCGERQGRAVEIRVARQKAAQVWNVLVCRDCWRAWEAMLDEGASGTQPGLQNVTKVAGLWFL